MSNLLQMPHRCAESSWEERDFAPRRQKNGPDTMDSICRGVILSVLALTLLGFGAWMCKSFLEAENAIVHQLGGK